MSAQETYLKEIADAIREKDGTAEPIRGSEFADRIRGIPAGGTGAVSEQIYLPPESQEIELTGTGAIALEDVGLVMVLMDGTEAGCVKLFLCACLDGGGAERWAVLEYLTDETVNYRVDFQLPGDVLYKDEYSERNLYVCLPSAPMSGNVTAAVYPKAKTA